MRDGSGGNGQRFGGRDVTSDNRVVTRIDHLEDVVREHAMNELLPRAREHTRISIGVDKVDFIFYQKLQFGRRCSCWSKVDSGPDKQCPICFGQTFVTGFQKYGTVWECLDVTSPATTLVNIVPNVEMQRRPVPFTLLPISLRGYVEWTVKLKPNIGTVDLIDFASYSPKGTSVKLYVRTSTESTFTEVTARATVESRLRDSLNRPNTLVFRVVMRRGRNAKVPLFSHLHLRYRTLENITITADVPRDNTSITLAEMGLYESWQPIQVILDNTVHNLSTEDFFIRVRDGRRYKVTESNPYKPMGIVIGTDAQARLVQRYENYANVP